MKKILSENLFTVICAARSWDYYYRTSAQASANVNLLVSNGINESNN